MEYNSEYLHVHEWLILMSKKTCKVAKITFCVFTK